VFHDERICAGDPSLRSVMTNLLSVKVREFYSNRGNSLNCLTRNLTAHLPREAPDIGMSGH